MSFDRASSGDASRLAVELDVVEHLPDRIALMSASSRAAPCSSRLTCTACVAEQGLCMRQEPEQTHAALQQERQQSSLPER
jgi:hypothetical protein